MITGFELEFDHWGTINFVPLAKILGDIFILSGTDKLIFIQHFTFIQASQQKTLCDPCNTRKVKLLVSRLFLFILFKQKNQ